jgi:hypothetical protein
VRLIPRALRPMTLIRRRMMRGGLKSDSDIYRLMALLLVGRPALVRSTAMRQGFAGRDKFWRLVAYGIIANDVRRKLTVKQPERLGTERLLEGQSVVVSALPRSGRRRAS